MKNENVELRLPALLMVGICMMGCGSSLKSQQANCYDLLWDQVQSRSIELKECDSISSLFLQGTRSSWNMILNERSNRKFLARANTHRIVDANRVVVMLCISEFLDPRPMRILSIDSIEYTSQSYVFNNERIGRKIRERQGSGIWGISSVENFQQYHEYRKENPCLAGSSHPNVCMVIEILREETQYGSLQEVSIYYE